MFVRFSVPAGHELFCFRPRPVDSLLRLLTLFQRLACPLSFKNLLFISSGTSRNFKKNKQRQTSRKGRCFLLSDLAVSPLAQDHHGRQKMAPKKSEE